MRKRARRRLRATVDRIVFIAIWLMFFVCGADSAAFAILHPSPDAFADAACIFVVGYALWSANATGKNRARKIFRKPR